MSWPRSRSISSWVQAAAGEPRYCCPNVGPWTRCYRTGLESWVRLGCSQVLHFQRVKRATSVWRVVAAGATRSSFQNPRECFLVSPLCYYLKRHQCSATLRLPQMILHFALRGSTSVVPQPAHFRRPTGAISWIFFADFWSKSRLLFWSYWSWMEINK